MKILALEHNLLEATAEKFRDFAREEACKVWDLYQAGLIRELYFRGDRNEAVLVLESNSVMEAQAVLAELPFVQQGLIRFELIPLRAYPGFERLFASR